MKIKFEKNIYFTYNQRIIFNKIIKIIYYICPLLNSI